MNTEAAMVLTNGRQLPAPRKLLFLRVGKFGRALKSNLARTLAKPPVQHPLQTLTFYNGTICQLQAERLAGEYMALSGIEVVRKLALKELDDERCEYRFELNGPTDSIWRFYLKKLLPEISIGFESKVMLLICRPADLEPSYQRSKGAIAQANQWYAEERERLISIVIAKDEERRAAEELEQNRRLGLRRQFDYLPL